MATGRQPNSGANRAAATPTPAAQTAATTVTTTAVVPPKEEKKVPKLPSFSAMRASFITIWNNSGLQTFARFIILGSAVAVMAIFLAISIMVNVTGAGKEMTALFFFALLIIASGIWITPLFLTRNTNTAKDLKNYFHLLAEILLWSAAVFAGLAFLSFEGRGWFIAMLIPLFTVTALGFRWGYRGTWARPIIYYSSMILITAVFAIVLIANFSVPLIGVDLSTDSETTALAKQINERERIQALNEIRKEAAKGVLSEKSREYLRKNSAWGKFTSLFKSDPIPTPVAAKTAAIADVKPAVPAPAVAPAPVPARVFTDKKITPVTKTGVALYLNNRYEAEVAITRNGGTITLEGRGVKFVGTQANDGTYSGTWTRGREHGTFANFQLRPSGNIVATGDINKRLPFELRRA